MPAPSPIARPTASEIAACAPCSRRMGGAGIRRGLRGGGARPFTPSQIADLVLDLDGDRGITIATGISAWADQSGGTAHDATQATTTKQPSYTASDATFNGHGSITGDGVNDGLIIPAHADLQLAGGITIYIVLQLPVGAPGGSKIILAERGGSVSTGYNIFWNSLGNIRAQLRNAADTANYTVISTTAIVLGQPRILRVMYDLTALSLAVDGTVEGSVAAPDFKELGQDLGVFMYNNGSISSPSTSPRILIYSRAVTAAEDARIVAYLNGRYAI